MPFGIDGSRNAWDGDCDSDIGGNFDGAWGDGKAGQNNFGDSPGNAGIISILIWNV